MMKITDLSKCKNFYCPPEVQFIELRIERGFAESSYSATETWPVKIWKPMTTENFN